MLSLVGGCFDYCVRCWFIAVAVSAVLGVRGLGVSCCWGWGCLCWFFSWFGLVGLPGWLGFGSWLVCGF